MNNQLQVIDDVMKKASSALASTIQQYKWELVPDSQLHAAKAALTKSDYIMKIAASAPEAVHDALIKGAILGVDLTEGKRQAWLVPRKDASGRTVIQMQVGYKGVEAIHQRMGVLDRLTIRVVRKNDVFEWSGDDQEKPVHNADWFASEESRGPIVGAYSITYFPDKSIQVATAPVSEIYEKHRDIADSWKSYQSKINNNQKAFPPPWVTFEKAMIEKTMAYIASKQWPANIRDEGQSSKILETLHEVDTSDYVSAFSVHTVDQLEYYNEAINSNDCLGLFLFERMNDLEVNLSIWSDFKKSIPKGEIGRTKDKLKNMVEMGQDVLTEIEEAIANNDEPRFLENTDDCLDRTKKMLWHRFNNEQRGIVSQWGKKEG